MKEPLRTRYAPGYDLFKLIVAVILTILLIFLLLRESQNKFAPLEMPTPLPTATAQAGITVTTTLTPEPTESTAASTSTLEPTETPIPPTPTIEPSPTLSPTPEPTAAETSPASDVSGCPANPTRINVGDHVKVLDWLNFRVEPGLNFPIQHTNRPGTEMEVIGGPTCTIRGGDPPRAYLWWNVKMQDGREGWSAEAPLNFPNYFMEPVK